METTKAPFVFCILVMTMALFLLAAISQQHFILEINSDSLYPFEIVTNFIQNKTLSGQNVPLAPYYFPDLIVLLVLNGLTHNIAILHFLYSALFLSVYLILVFRLVHVIFQDKHHAAMVVLLAFTQCFFMIVPGFNFLREWPGSHLSVLLFSLWFLRAYWVNRHRDITPLQFAIGFLLTYFMFISDKLLFAQFLFPFALIVIMERVQNKTTSKNAIGFLVMMVCVVLLGAKIEFFLQKYFALTSSENANLFRIRKLAHIDQSLRLLRHFFAVSISENKIVYGTLLMDTMFSFFFIFYSKKKQFAAPIKGLLLFLYVSVVATIILALLVGKLTDRAHFRYLGPLYFWPPIGFAGALALIFKERPLFLWSIILGNMGLGVLMYHPFSLLKGLNAEAPYNTSIQCIDALQNEYPIKNGLAEYWSVRPVRMLSKRGISVTQINKDLHFFNLIDNPSHFRADSYQFIIVNKLSSEKIKDAIGKPDRMVLCPDHEIWLYIGKDSNGKMNRYFLSQRGLK